MRHWLHRLYLAGTPPILESAVISGLLQGVTVEMLVKSVASENFVDKTIAERLALPFSGEPTPIAMASSEVSVEMFGKARGMLNLLDRSYPDVAFSVINNLYADVIVGQEFFKRHSSVTFEMQGPKRILVTLGSASNPPGQLAVAAAKLDLPELIRILATSMQTHSGAHAGGTEGDGDPLNGNRLNTNLLLTFVKTQNNSAHACIAILKFRL